MYIFYARYTCGWAPLESSDISQQPNSSEVKPHQNVHVSKQIEPHDRRRKASVPEFRSVEFRTRYRGLNIDGWDSTVRMGHGNVSDSSGVAPRIAVVRDGCTRLLVCSGDAAPAPGSGTSWICGTTVSQTTRLSEPIASGYHSYFLGTFARMSKNL